MVQEDEIDILSMQRTPQNSVCQSNRTIQLKPCFIILPQADLLLPVGVFL